MFTTRHYSTASPKFHIYHVDLGQGFWVVETPDRERWWNESFKQAISTLDKLLKEGRHALHS